MKRKTAIFVMAALCALLISFLLCESAGAEESAAREYLVTEESGEYQLFVTEDATSEKLASGESLSALLELTSDGSRVVFDNVCVREDLVLSGRCGFVFSGGVTFEGACGLTLESEDVCFSSLALNFAEGGVRLKSGTLRLEASDITSEAVAIRQDYADSSLLIMSGGSLKSLSDEPAVILTRGTARILDGQISTVGEYGIRNGADLVLGRGVEVCPRIYTERRIFLHGVGDAHFALTYGREFFEGTMTEVLLYAKEADLGRVSLCDKEGRECELRFFESSEFSDEKNFLAVFNPICVTYKDGEKTLFVREELVGNIPLNCTPNDKTGYEFDGWYADISLGERCYFDSPLTADTTLYAGYRLLPPEYSVSSLEFTYDERVHKLGLDTVEHPLMSEGSFVYEWYKDGEYVTAGEFLNVKSTSDSGEYSCKITFRYSRDSVSVMTPTINVKVKKALIKTPEIPALTYTGTELFPSVTPSLYYTFSSVGATESGVYPVEFSIVDFENYGWKDSLECTLSVGFEIRRATNAFSGEISVFDTYFLAENDFSASSLFGEARFEYYESVGGEALSTLPILPGEYFAVAVVDATANYTALRSEAYRFSILEERPLAITVSTPPDKTEYAAFEKFLVAGLSVSVNYNSGRTETVGAERLGVKYQSAESFRFGDNAVEVFYLGASVHVPVAVRRADYDVSEIGFGELFFEYNGEFNVPTLVGEMPVGEDGVPLLYKIEGGGTDAGEYGVRIVFYTESENYNTPRARAAVMTVAKRETQLEWGEVRFVYNGKRQTPTAAFTDVLGVKRMCEVTGGAYNAGEDYVALALDVPNYSFSNPSASFEILKADFDLASVAWSAQTFVYDGAAHSVFITGLPDGLRVSGYVNNYATDAGEYVAAVGVSFDAQNYNAPILPTHKWTILPASYDLSTFEFLDAEAEFDGKVHFPILIGTMPKGHDGTALEYEFDGGAVHVSDGAVAVKISFCTESTNYLVPEPIVRTVRILPMAVLVSWQGLTFTYDGEEHAPFAYSAACEVFVTGKFTDAGEYVATAVSANPDYYVANADVRFVIEKAENRFVEAAYALDVFEGYELSLGAVGYFGEAQFLFFSDKELKNRIDAPAECGVYYAVAYIAESKNFLPLYSEALCFEIKEVRAVGIRAELAAREYFAFETLDFADVRIFERYNDETEREIDFALVRVTYESGDSLRCGDGGVAFSFGEFSFCAEICVRRADFDLSGLRWTNLFHTYDGLEKRAELVGVPDGMSVVSIDGGVGTRAGEYRVRAVVDYDEENYNPPIIPEATLVIERARVALPELMPWTYDGTPHVPHSESPLWKISSDAVLTDAGEYTLSAVLTDAENYVFENGEEQASFVAHVLPREITVKVEDVLIYVFEEYRNPELEIVGEVISGEELGVEYIVSDDSVSVRISNPNYKARVIDGKIERLSIPSPRGRVILFILFLLVILFGLLISVLIYKRERIASALAGFRAKRRRSRPSASFESVAPPKPEDEETGGSSKEKRNGEEVEQNQTSDGNGGGKGINDSEEKKNKNRDEWEYESLEGFVAPMDTERADSLLTNSLAKELLETADEVIYTEGRRRGVINVDTLSRHFDAGDRVDVNILKSKSLIPYDTGYLKVLARGVVDKPLYVYANDFSLSAVKMLALTGGKAVKVTTVKLKMPKRDVFENEE